MPKACASETGNYRNARYDVQLVRGFNFPINGLSCFHEFHELYFAQLYGNNRAWRNEKRHRKLQRHFKRRNILRDKIM